MDSLSALTTFMRAAEVRSFTGAGQQLGLSSSAIGKSVARLEERLGVRLFHRTTRSVTLTPEGQLLLASCHRITSEIKAVEQEFAQKRGEPRGKLRVSLPSIGTWMTMTLNQFMRSYPEIELDMEFSDHLVDVVGGAFDAVIRTGEIGDSRLMSRTLGTYRLKIVGSPAYFARVGFPEEPEDLSAHSCLHHRLPTTGKLQRWSCLKPQLEDETALPVTATVSAVEPLVSLVELGLGIACLPEFTIRRQIEEGTLLTVLNEYDEHAEVLRVMWSSSRFMSPRLRAFIDFLAKNTFPIASPAHESRLWIAPR